MVLLAINAIFISIMMLELVYVMMHISLVANLVWLAVLAAQLVLMKILAQLASQSLISRIMHASASLAPIHPLIPACPVAEAALTAQTEIPVPHVMPNNVTSRMQTINVSVMLA